MRYFGECASTRVSLMFFSGSECEEDHRGEAPLSSHVIKSA